MRRETVVQEQTVLQIGNVQVKFYVREPSPDRWNAVGVVDFGDEPLHIDAQSTCRLIVGSGSTRDEAIGDLIARVLSGQHPALRHSARGPFVDQALLTSDQR
jgi:hypothetical protein